MWQAVGSYQSFKQGSGWLQLPARKSTCLERGQRLMAGERGTGLRLEKL